MKKLILILALFAVLLNFLVSCDDNTVESEQTSAASVKSEEELDNTPPEETDKKTESENENKNENENENKNENENESEVEKEPWGEPKVTLQESFVAGDYELALNAEGTEYTIVKYLGEEENAKIISSYNGIPVTRLAPNSFAGNWTLKSIEIPEGIRTIANSAFNSWYYLTAIDLPKTLQYIGTQAFCYCNDVISITVAEGNPWFHANGNCLIETATKTLVRGCSTSVIPNDGSVEIITWNSFYEAKNMKELIIPKSVKEIRSSFYVLPELESITVEEGNPYYHSSGNCLIDTTRKTLILGCNNSVIPNDGSVERIEGLSFYNCTRLKSVVIPASVTYIGHAPFANCIGIEELVVAAGNSKYSSSGNCLIETATKTLLLGCKTSVIPTDGSVTIIGDSAFNGQDLLTSIVIPNCITEIGEAVFSGCDNLSNVVLPNGITVIKERAFSWCPHLTTLTIPNSVTKIESEALGHCDNLTVYFKGTQEQWDAIEKHPEYLIWAGSETQLTLICQP